MDPITVVEAAYRLQGDANEWLKNLASAARPLLEEEGGSGVVGLLIDAERTTAEMPYLIGTATEGVPDAMFAGFGGCARIGARASTIALIRAAGPASTLSAAMSDSFSEPEGFEDLFRGLQVKDSAYVLAGDPLGVCCVLASPLQATYRMAAPRVAMWQLVGAHIATGFRLRRRTEPCSRTAEDGEAILDIKGRLVHAEPVVLRSGERREELRRAALDAIHARGELRKRDPLRALSLWQALVSGRWSLVDRLESDGKHFIVARRNEPTARADAALTPREMQVASLAALGHPNKVIAYELGIALSSVATLLRRALRRLRLRNRAELVDLFSRSLP